MSRTEADRMQALYSNDWLTPKQAGESAGVSAEVIIAACDAGELTWMNAASPGSERRRIQIRRPWLEAWIDNRTHRANAA